jgi:Rrf2 family protein
LKISTKGRYALRMLVDVAQHQSSGTVTLKEIAGRQGISKKYLEQIISVLNKAGYVRSIRGPQGGYMLAKEPKDYTVGMLLRTTEGDLAPVSCVGNGAVECDRADGCVTVRIWQKINDAVDNVVDNITLADLVEWQNEKKEN